MHNEFSMDGNYDIACGCAYFICLLLMAIVIYMDEVLLFIRWSKM